MKKFTAALIVFLSLFLLTVCFAETKNTSLCDYIFEMWTDKTLIWQELFFAEHDIYSRKYIDPYPEDRCWIILIPEEGKVQLSGKSSNGKWIATTWENATFDEMTDLCMAMCMTWDNYVNIGNLGIMYWYEDQSESRYIVSKEGADNFLEVYKRVYGIEDEK